LLCGERQLSALAPNPVMVRGSEMLCETA
jgi:hypothetical protein